MSFTLYYELFFVVLLVKNVELQRYYYNTSISNHKSNLSAYKSKCFRILCSFFLVKSSSSLNEAYYLRRSHHPVH